MMAQNAGIKGKYRALSPLPAWIRRSAMMLAVNHTSGAAKAQKMTNLVNSALPLVGAVAELVSPDHPMSVIHRAGIRVAKPKINTIMR
jgi:hypothetical protein